MNAVLQAIRSRRSCRAFTEKKVERGDLEAIVDAGLWAPSGKNSQCWHFSVLTNEEKIQKLAKFVGTAVGNPESYDFYKPTALILLSCPKGYTHIMADCAAATENMLLAAESLGVASCWINQVRVATDDPAVRALLTEYGIPCDHDVQTTIALGYAAKPANEPPRKENLVTYID